jgi:hypothetical protein
VSAGPARDEPFDAEQFARDTISAAEYTDEDLEQLEDRLIRIEEVTAARWPRSAVLRWRLAREIRASVRTFDAAVYAPGDFRGRRGEWAALRVTVALLKRERRQGTTGTR